MSNAINMDAASRAAPAENAVNAAATNEKAAGHTGVVINKVPETGGGKLAGVPERSQIQSRIDDINRQLQLRAVSVQFQIDPGYKDVILKVVDQQDGKVVLQIPSEEVVRIAKVMDQMKGVLLEKTA
ncbi:flaG family protein [Collimonas fungivorans]|uniref:FlaG family protein n=1 Tax=Collimonas fungivorans TaxID=158899 RepID=A0A127P876_9BURK|nr:flagellar protein FlaG [Collimonas fungivorans]AMO93958.1 flaG family protein [Collimonas fungivorans]